MFETMEAAAPVNKKKTAPKPEWKISIVRSGEGFVGTFSKGDQSVDLRVPAETFMSKKGHELIPFQAKMADGGFKKVGYLVEVTHPKAVAKNIVLNGAIDLTPIGIEFKKKLTGFRLPPKEGKPLMVNFLETLERPSQGEKAPVQEHEEIPF